jgi:hypothetical protein
VAGPRSDTSSLQITAVEQSASSVEQLITSFPIMSRDQQVAQIGLDQGVTPPDTQIAAGSQYILEMVNNSISVWTRSSSLVKEGDLNAFFLVPPGYSFGDPRVLYDAASAQWFASGFAHDASNNSQCYVAVSQTSDPTGAWFVYTIESNTLGLLYDQPKLGISSDKVVISWNDYSAAGTLYSGEETWVLQKASMLTGSTTATSRFGPDITRFSIVPSQSLTATSTEYLVYNNSDPFLEENLGYPTLGVVAITGTPAQLNVTWTETDPSIGGTSIPPSAVQPAPGPPIETDDDRLLSAAWQNGILWTVGNTSCELTGDSAFRSCLRLIQVSTSTVSPTILQNDNVSAIGDYLFYPAVSFDTAGNAYFAFTQSSAGLYPTAMTSAQQLGVPNSIGTSLAIGSGLGIYDCSLCPLGQNRWGDYSAVAPDPANPANVWVAAEYSASTTDTLDWGTAAGEVSFASTSTPTATSTATPTPTYTPSPTATPTPPPRAFLPVIEADYSQSP